MAPPDEPFPAGHPDRAQERYPCRPRTLVQLAIRRHFQSFPAPVTAVSAAGSSFLLHRRLALRTALAVWWPRRPTGRFGEAAGGRGSATTLRHETCKKTGEACPRYRLFGPSLQESQPCVG